MIKKGVFGRNQKSLLKASLSSNFAFGLLAPIYAIFIDKIGGSILDIGYAYAIFAFVAGLFILIFDNSKFFVKHMRMMIVLGYSLVALCYIGYIFVESPWHLFLIQVIFGLANGILEPSWDSVYSAKLDEKQENRNWSIWAGSINITLGIAAIIGSFIIANYSFNLLFVIMAIFAIASAIFASRVLRK